MLYVSRHTAHTQLNTLMSYNSNFIQNVATLEYGKFLEILNDTRFPAASAVRVSYPQSDTLPPITSVDVYPKYAVLTYDATSNETNFILSALSAASSNTNNLLTTANTTLNGVSALLGSMLGQRGFTFIDPASNVVTGTYTSIQVLSACKIASLAASNSTVGNLSSYELAAGFVLNGPITSIRLSYGAVIAYK